MPRQRIVGHPVQSKVPVEILASAVITYMNEGHAFGSSRNMADFIRWCVEAKAEKSLTIPQAGSFLANLNVMSEGVEEAIAIGLEVPDAH